jgi:hypothetical protein
MRKVGLICLVLLAAMAMLGVSYAKWTQNVTASATTVSISSLSVTTNNADGLSTTGATLHGTLNGLGGYTSPVTVSFEYGTSTNYGTTVAGSPSSFTSVPGAFSATLSGLTSGTTYHFRAKATGYFTKYDGDNTFTTYTSVTLPPYQDSYINSGATTTNYGTNVNLLDGRSGNTYQKALIQFDLSSIPSGSTIESATLQLYATATGNQQDTVNIYRLRRSWNETQVTWVKSDTATSLGSVGAANTSSDFVNTIIASTPINGGTGVWYSWTVTNEVDAFVNHSVTNNGWLLYPTSPTGQEQTTFSSREGSFIPKLVVTYH